MKMTKMVNKAQVERDWIVIDAEGKIFGRLVTEIATYLRGKHKPYFTPHVDCGDHVIVINASKVKFTGGNKLNDKQYHRHSGYFGSVKSEKLGELVEKNPEKLFSSRLAACCPKRNWAAKCLKNSKSMPAANIRIPRK
jgi:large subunit ribosomal protein L13